MRYDDQEVINKKEKSFFPPPPSSEGNELLTRSEEESTTNTTSTTTTTTTTTTTMATDSKSKSNSNNRRSIWVHRDSHRNSSVRGGVGGEGGDDVPPRRNVKEEQQEQEQQQHQVITPNDMSVRPDCCVSNLTMDTSMTTITMTDTGGNDSTAGQTLVLEMDDDDVFDDEYDSERMTQQQNEQQEQEQLRRPDPPGPRDVFDYEDSPTTSFLQLLLWHQRNHPYTPMNYHQEDDNHCNSNSNSNSNRSHDDDDDSRLMEFMDEHPDEEKKGNWHRSKQRKMDRLELLEILSSSSSSASSSSSSSSSFNPSSSKLLTLRRKRQTQSSTSSSSRRRFKFRRLLRLNSYCGCGTGRRRIFLLVSILIVIVTLVILFGVSKDDPHHRLGKNHHNNHNDEDDKNSFDVFTHDPNKFRRQIQEYLLSHGISTSDDMERYQSPQYNAIEWLVTKTTTTTSAGTTSGDKNHGHHHHGPPSSSSTSSSSSIETATPPIWWNGRRLVSTTTNPSRRTTTSHSIYWDYDNDNDNGDDVEHDIWWLDRYILAVLFFSLHGDEWSNDFHFLQNDQHVCNWTSPLPAKSSTSPSTTTTTTTTTTVGTNITNNTSQMMGVTDCHINERGALVPTSISLDVKGLHGTLPHELLYLTDLQSLHIANNHAMGGGTLPSWISQMVSLESLSFPGCSIGPSFPITEVDALTHLTTLDFSRNRLHGSLPTKIAKLTALKTLRLGDNLLDCSLDPLNSLTNLQWLEIQNNLFKGELSSDFLTSLPDLLHLNASENKLSGTIPPEILQHSTLRDLDLRFNRFSGSIPSVTSNSPSPLEVLALDWNELEGSLPTDTLSNLVALKVFGVSSNLLTGTIPKSLIHTSSDHPPPLLRSLTLGNNPFHSGRIPSFLWRMPTLESLDLSRLGMIGTIPESIGFLSALKDLDLSWNAFNGSLPEEMSLLTNLQWLHLEGNKLSGNTDAICDSSEERKRETTTTKFPFLKLFVSDCETSSHSRSRPTTTTASSSVENGEKQHGGGEDDEYSPAHSNTKTPRSPTATLLLDCPCCDICCGPNGIDCL